MAIPSEKQTVSEELSNETVEHWKESTEKMQRELQEHAQWLEDIRNGQEACPVCRTYRDQEWMGVQIYRMPCVLCGG